MEREKRRRKKFRWERSEGWKTKHHHRAVSCDDDDDDEKNRCRISHKKSQPREYISGFLLLWMGKCFFGIGKWYEWRLLYVMWYGMEWLLWEPKWVVIFDGEMWRFLGFNLVGGGGGERAQWMWKEGKRHTERWCWRWRASQWLCNHMKYKACV